MLKTEDLPDILTVEQVADYLNISRNPVYALCTSGELVSFKTGNTRRVRKEALLSWIKEKEAQHG